MAYLPGFEHDVFISYAHADNQPLGGHCWVDEFHEALQVAVHQYLGVRPAIWRDPRTTGIHDFSEDIKGQLRSSALLLSIFSPSYLNSKWCRLEFEEFLLARGTNPTRVIKVVKTHVERAELHESLQHVLGYCFYRHDEMCDKRREHRIDDAEGRRAYWAVMDDLAQDLARLLRALKTRTGQATPTPSGRVYLALTTSDLDGQRCQIKRELEARRYQVLPDRLPPSNRAPSEQFLREQLAQADLYVQLLGAYYGTSFEDNATTLAQLQYELAATGLRADKRGVLWVAPGQKIEDTRQQRFLDTITGSLTGSFDFLTCPLEELKTLVLDRLQTRTQPSRPTDARERPRRVYVICDKDDIEHVKPLKTHFFQKHVEPLVLSFHGHPDASAIRKLHRDHLKVCDGVLVHWAEGNEAWLQAKLSEIRKAIAIRKNVPFRGRGVYITDPLNHDKEEFNTLEADMVLRHSGAYSPTVLDPFLAKVV